MNEQQYRTVIGWFNARPAAKKGAAGCQHGVCGGGVSAVSGPAGLVGLACHVGAAGGYCRGACGGVCGGYGSACGY